MTRILNSQNEHLGYGMILVSGILWGLAGIFVKNLNAYGASSELIAFLRVSMAFIIMLAFCISKFGIKSLKISRRQLGVCALLGFACHGIYNIFYNSAITELGVSFSTVMLYLSPAMTLILSAVIYKEKIRPIKIVAIIINIIGCGLTVTNGRLSLSGIAFTGILLGLGASACYSLNAIIGKKSEKNANPFIMCMYSFLFASLLLLVAIKPWTLTSSLNTGIICWGFLYALIPTSLTYGVYYCGMQKIRDCSKVPVIASVEIVVASLVGVLIYHEHLGHISIMGIALVLASIIVMNAGRQFRKIMQKYILSI